MVAKRPAGGDGTHPPPEPPPPPPAKKARSGEVELTPDEVRVVRIQFEKDNPGAAILERFDELVHEYCRFLTLKVTVDNKDDNDDDEDDDDEEEEEKGSGTSGGNQLAPSYLIDRLWHAHILSTRAYLAFCDRHNGGSYLHHDPALKRGQERYERTLEALKDRYQESGYDAEIWPEDVDAKPAAANPASASNYRLWDLSEDDESEVDEEEEEDMDEEDRENRAIKMYLEDYGDERGTTEEELKEWHREAILDPTYNKGHDPRENPDSCNCLSGCRWYDREFSLHCPDCRESSSGLDDDSFTCG